MSTSDTEFATASPRRSILLVAMSPEDAAAAADGLKGKLRRWRLQFTPTTPEALALLRSAPYDAVVMNLQARGIDPTRFLREVMESCPETLRIGLTSNDDRRSIQEAGVPVHQFLAKPLDPMVLTAVLARAFAGQDFLSQEHFRRLVERIQTLPVLPAAYTAILDELNGEDPSAERVGELVARDMALSTKMLQLVNSAFFGLGRVISHPAEATMFLGTETVKALVLSLTVFSQFDRLRVKQFSPEALWRHSWTTGVLARRLCEFEETERSVAEEAFLAGLLHDIGKLLLAANYPELMEKNLEESAQKKIALWEQEFLVHGASHAELGGFLLRKWGLPAGVVDAVTFHHRPMLARVRSFAAVTAVHLANTLPRVLAGDSAIPTDLVDVGYLRTLGMEDRLEDWKSYVGGQMERSTATASAA
jgi:putative nucleotidyltransferase with HDIG domain